MERSRHAGRDGGQGGAADDCTSDVAAGRRRMALATVAWSSLKISTILANGRHDEDVAVEENSRHQQEEPKHLKSSVHTKNEEFLQILIPHL